MATPQNTSSDDAAILAINSAGSSDDDDADDVDDPATRGQPKALSLDMFRARPWKNVPPGRLNGRGVPRKTVLLTPGASRVDVNPEPTTLRERAN